MMSRKFSVLFAAIAVACAGVAARAADVLIGDFEALPVAGSIGALDGWVGQGDNAGPNPGPTTGTLAQNANAEIATAGGIYKNGAQDITGNVLRLLPGLANFWSLSLNQAARPTLAGDIATHRTLKANVTFRVVPFTQGNFGQWTKIALNGQPAGWQEASDPPGPGGATAWTTADGVKTYELSWDLTAMNIANTASGSNAQLIMSVNYDRASYSAQPNGPAFYIDNIRLGGVPEPASITLVGLGAMGLLGLRRRG